MNLCDFAPEYIRSIQPYQPGKPISELAREMGLDEAYVIKLASNENPLGTSPLALDAMINALHNVALYPDGSGYELKVALSKRYAVAPEQIILGNGSNDVLDLAARVFLKPGAAAVYSQHAFAVYPLVVQMVGALAALQDTEFVQKSYALNRAGMLQLTDGFRKLGIETIPSYGNFISFRVKGDATNTPKIYQSLLRQGIIVRPLGIYEMPHHLRVTIGLASENEQFLESLENAMGELA
jgi:histidinol-phosphate/aromatic aminotransferase/cobyric acid decarboxylase-like protein